MTQTAIPFLFMRGGTSRGPYFRRADLPENRDALAELLISALGAGHPLNIDGIGGGAAVTTKVAMLSRSQHDWAEIDYFFAQVSPTAREVDFAPTCGNILAGVGPAAVELGLTRAGSERTSVKIHSVNTGALVEAEFATPGGAPDYQGEARIDGVPGTAAPIVLNFMDVIGSKTGALFPTGRPIEEIDGIAVSLVDAAMPMMIARAQDFGVTGYESREELDANRALYERLEPIRKRAGVIMGLANDQDAVAKSVIPKIGLLAAPRDGGCVTSRYFMPWDAHPSHAVTGAICVAACALAPGTVAEGVAQRPSASPATVVIEHPSGKIEVVADYTVTGGALDLRKAGLLRTARKLAAGEIFVPGSVWAGG